MADIGDIEPMVDGAFDFMGVGLLEDEIDDVIFQTNQFLLNSDFIGNNGPFWWLSEIPDLRGSNHPENQSLGDLSRETNVLGGTKTGQNGKKTYLIICLSHPTFQTSHLQVQSYEIVPIITKKFKKICD